MSHPTVLLVDADVDTRDMYEAAFSLEGFRTIAAASALDGFAAARDLAPAVIVADVGAPGRSHTFDMTAWLQRDERTRDIPVVAVTGYDLTRDAQRIPFARVLLKPVALEALVASAYAAVARSSALRQRANRRRARVAEVLPRSRRARGRSARVATEHAAKLRCPRCRELFTASFARVGTGARVRQYRPCRNGCGLFYYDASRRRMVALVR